MRQEIDVERPVGQVEFHLEPVRCSCLACLAGGPALEQYGEEPAARPIGRPPGEVEEDTISSRRERDAVPAAEGLVACEPTPGAVQRLVPSARVGCSAPASRPPVVPVAV